MEINYYPLGVDKKYGSSIVSSTDPGRGAYLQKDKEYEIENYGGHIIAESLPSKELAQQLVDAYNEKYGPVTKPHHLPQTIVIDGRQPMLGSGYKWQIITPDGYIYREDKQQSNNPLHLYKLAKAPEFPSEDYMDINSPSGTKVTVSERSFKNGNEGDKDNAKKYLKVGEVYTVSYTDVGRWHTLVSIKEIPDIDFNSVQFVKYKEQPVFYVKGIKEFGEVEQIYPWDTSMQFKLPTNPDHIMKPDPHFDQLGDIMREKLMDEVHHEFKDIDNLGAADELDMADAMQREYPDGISDLNRQISFIRNKRERHLKNNTVGVSLMYQLIEENLMAVKQYHQVDVVKVIEDLLQTARLWGLAVTRLPDVKGDVEHNKAIQNAEAALGMLQAFKRKPDINDIQSKKDKIALYLVKNVNPLGIEEAKAIVFAIEEIIKLKGIGA